MEVGILLLVSRWLHLLAAMTAVGGTFFMRWALLPTSEELPEDARKKLHAGVRARWAIPVHASIGFLLLSGLYTFVARSVPLHRGDGLYHGLFGAKFLLALAIFFIATMLVGRSAAAEKFRENRRLWLNINVVLAVLIVCISGVMRFRTPTSAAESIEPTQVAVGVGP
jgi:uncharacterized membrane protein